MTLVALHAKRQHYDARSARVCVFSQASLLAAPTLYILVQPRVKTISRRNLQISSWGFEHGVIFASQESHSFARRPPSPQTLPVECLHWQRKLAAAVPSMSVIETMPAPAAAEPFRYVARWLIRHDMRRSVERKQSVRTLTTFWSFFHLQHSATDTPNAAGPGSRTLLARALTCSRGNVAGPLHASEGEQTRDRHFQQRR